MNRTYNTEVPLPEDFEVPDHVPPELVRDYDFLKTFQPNTLAEPFSKTARVFEDQDIPPIFYAPSLTIWRGGSCAWPLRSGSPVFRRSPCSRMPIARSIRD